MGIYIKDLKMPEGGYRTIEIGYDADGHPMAIADGGDVFDVIPIADVIKLIHAYWVWDGYDYGKPWTCSKCCYHSENETNFCPNCGADMRPEPPKEE